MIRSVKLFSATECEDISKRVLSFHSNFYSEFPDAYLQCLGYPIYLSCLQKKPRSLKNTAFFNDLIRESFGDVLAKTIDALKTEINDNVYLENHVSYPGFHVIKVPPGEKTASNFHLDTEFTFLSHFHPELEIKKTDKCLSFTILMNVEESLTAGLHYVDDPALTHEVLVNTPDKKALNDELLARAAYHPYEAGSMNLHSNIPHSIFGENNGNEVMYRISFQGHLIPAKKGHLLYW